MPINLNITVRTIFLLLAASCQSAAGLRPSLSEPCMVTDFPALCRGTINGQTNVNAATDVAIRELMKRTRHARDIAKKELKVLDGGVATCLSNFNSAFDNLDKAIKNKCQYAVRGELYLRASEPQKEGKKIIFTNVGNPHALGQKPLTFPRQVVALCQAPFLLDDPNVGMLFPADAIERAKHYLSLTSDGLGAYSDSRGLPGVRKEVAEFIQRRDGYPRDVKEDGVGSLVPYYLDESENWGHDVNNLRQSVSQARSQGISVRAMVIINPGNPTGQCLSEANLREILRFCYSKKLVLLGDEVYQQNIYQDERPFISSKKVLMDMGSPFSKEVQLVSFHTVSKGYWGECGQRGGYFEMTNFPPRVVEEIYKVASIALSPNVSAQIFMGLMVSPPKPGDISYDQFTRESTGILESLRRRAKIMTDGFNSCKNVVVEEIYKVASIALSPNVSAQIFMGLMVSPPKPGDISYDQFTRESKGILESLRRRAKIMTDGFNSCKNVVCNFTEGAMYSFPQIQLPPGALQAAKQAGKVPDVFYCLKLLEATGISTVPGSGFGQREGVFHLRTTILPAEEEMPEIMDSFKKFNDEFMTRTNFIIITAVLLLIIYKNNWEREKKRGEKHFLFLGGLMDLRLSDCHECVQVEEIKCDPIQIERTIRN
ncbi:hypothetical protein YC2023_083730 [Brassica napus]